MRFGPLSLSDAQGAVLAHSVSVEGLRLRKGHVLSAGDVAQLQEAGLDAVIAAKLDPDELGEDEAAERLARAIPAQGIETRRAATGRVNLHATVDGLFSVERALIDHINALDPVLTIATLPPFSRVPVGGMVATVKIIPFGVSSRLLARAESVCEGAEGLAVHPFRPLRAALVQTELPGLKPSVLDKTARVMGERMAALGGCVAAERRVAHEADAVACAVRALLPDADIAILFGASAVSDEADVLPAAIRAAGGVVERVGMPVDPGNLLVLGALDGKPVIGAPGCARSPKENGLDWVLARIAAGLPVAGTDLAGMGVGGLLTEIPSRPQPRDLPRSEEAKVAAVVLAAGRSSRMGGPNKLLARFEGAPLVRIIVERALASDAMAVAVVTGHQAERVADALDGLPLRLVENPCYASGLASSLKTGIAAVPDEADGALVILGDMPAVSSADLDRMIAAFRRSGGESVVRATAFGRRGNPVILPRALFGAVRLLEGDTGARQIVEAADAVDVELGEGALLDVDTPEALAAAGGLLQD